MTMKTYTETQLIEMRKRWDIAENFIPVASAPGVIAWANKNSVAKLAKNDF